MFSTDTEAALGAAINTMPMVGLGHMAIGVSDCSGQSLAGAQVECDACDGATVAYVENGTPNVDATVTDASGAMGFVNVAPGPVTVTATIDGEAVSSQNVFVREGYWGFFQLTPLR